MPGNTDLAMVDQRQLVWSTVSFNKFSDVFGAQVALHNGDSLNARIGLSADYRNAWRDAKGKISSTNIYGIVNLYREFMREPSIDVSGIGYATQDRKLWGGLGVGGTYAWADNKYAIYGEGSLNTNFHDVMNSYTVKATLGIKTKW